MDLIHEYDSTDGDTDGDSTDENTDEDFTKDDWLWERLAILCFTYEKRNCKRYIQGG